MSQVVSVNINLSTSKKTRMKWTLDMVKKEAEKYSTKSEFKRECRSAYNWAYKAKLLDDMFDNVCMSWDLAGVKKEALKYTKRNDFKIGSSSAYNWAYRNKMLDEVCKNMNPVVEWNLEKVKELASKYTTRVKFKNENRGAYQWALVNGVMDSITGHMVSSKFTFNKEEGAILYYLQLKNGLYKIGITNRSVRERFYGDNDKIKVLAEVHYLKGSDAIKREQELMKEFKEFKYHGPKVLKTGGNTELFTRNVLNI